MDLGERLSTNLFRYLDDVGRPGLVVFLDA